MTTDVRAALRAAITNAEQARTTRAAAAEALKRADAVLSANNTERERAQAALAKSEADHAKVIAKQIRSGKSADVALTASIKAAQSTLVEIESRARMAKQARDQIADELADAEARANDAEAAVAQSALDVVVAEVERETEPLTALLTQLCAIDDLAFGVARLWHGGSAIPLTPQLRQVITRLQPIREMLASVRPQRVILTGTWEDAAMGRLEKYRKALAANPDTKLSDIDPPEIKQPTIRSGNAIVAARVAVATRVAAA